LTKVICDGIDTVMVSTLWWYRQSEII